MMKVLKNKEMIRMKDKEIKIVLKAKKVIYGWITEPVNKPKTIILKTQGNHISIIDFVPDKLEIKECKIEVICKRKRMNIR